MIEQKHFGKYVGQPSLDELSRKWAELEYYLSLPFWPNLAAVLLEGEKVVIVVFELGWVKCFE